MSGAPPDGFDVWFHTDHALRGTGKWVVTGRLPTYSVGESNAQVQLLDPRSNRRIEVWGPTCAERRAKTWLGRARTGPVPCFFWNGYPH